MLHPTYRLCSLAALSVVATLATRAGATAFTWTGAAGDQQFETPGNYNPSTAFPGQVAGGDSLLFDATSTGVSINNSNLFPNYQPFSVTWNNAQAFTVGTLGTTSNDLTSSGTTFRLQAGTANQTFNINVSLASGTSTTAAFNTFRNDTTLASGTTLTTNGNISSQTTGRRYAVSFFGTGAKVANGVISDGTGGLPVVVVVANSGDTSGSGALTGQQYGSTTLTNANTYTGGTIVTGQTLLVNNTAGSGTGTGAVAVSNLGINQNNYATPGGSTSGSTSGSAIANTTGILGGNGTIGGTIAVQSGGSLRPGATAADGSTSNLTSTNATASALVLSAGSTSIFDINGTAKGAATDGYDAFTDAAAGSTITYGGAFTINGNALTIATYDLFTSSQVAGDFASITLNLGTTPLALTETGTGAAGVWTASAGGNSYTFIQATGDLSVAAVPEPATLGLGAVAASLLLARRRPTRG